MNKEMKRVIWGLILIILIVGLLSLAVVGNLIPLYLSIILTFVAVLVGGFIIMYT